MVPFPYHGMPMFSGNPEMSIQQQHFQRLQQLLMQQHQWDSRLAPQYYNGHDISPTKIKVQKFNKKSFFAYAQNLNRLKTMRRRLKFKFMIFDAYAFSIYRFRYCA